MKNILTILVCAVSLFCVSCKSDPTPSQSPEDLLELELNDIDMELDRVKDRIRYYIKNDETNSSDYVQYLDIVNTKYGKYMDFKLSEFASIELIDATINVIKAKKKKEIIESYLY